MAEGIDEFRERLTLRLSGVAGLDPTSALWAAVLAASVEAMEDVHAARRTRRRCAVCGEPVVLDDPDDPDSWIHAEDAADWGDHSAEIDAKLSRDGGSVLGEGVAG